MSRAQLWSSHIVVYATYISHCPIWLEFSWCFTGVLHWHKFYTPWQPTTTLKVEFQLEHLPYPPFFQPTGSFQAWDGVSNAGHGWGSSKFIHPVDHPHRSLGQASTNDHMEDVLHKWGVWAKSCTVVNLWMTFFRDHQSFERWESFCKALKRGLHKICQEWAWRWWWTSSTAIIAIYSLDVSTTKLKGKYRDMVILGWQYKDQSALDLPY